MKYHINKNGVLSVCKAKTRPCPLGGQHFNSREEGYSYQIASAEAELRAGKPLPTTKRPAKNIDFNGKSYPAADLYVALCGDDFNEDLYEKRQLLGGAITLAQSEYPYITFTPVRAANFNKNRHEFILDNTSAAGADTKAKHIENSYEDVRSDSEIVAYEVPGEGAHAVSFTKLYYDRLESGYSRSMLEEAETVGVHIPDLWNRYKEE